MTSFALAIEPAAQPRLAAWLALLHAAVSLAPWVARCPAPLAVTLTVLALAGFWSSIAWVPGRHCDLRAVALDGSGCRVRLAGETAWRAAAFGAGTRAYPDCVLLDVRVAGHRVGWLLPRGAVPAAAFRRLKARIRLTC